MFEAYVLICLLKDPTNCRTLLDTEGPYNNEKSCVSRAYEIASELPEWLPDYVATQYKCNTRNNVNGKINI